MFIISCLSIAKHVIDSVSWCANTSGEYYYEEQIGEEILEDLEPAEDEREWHADDIK